MIRTRLLPPLVALCCLALLGPSLQAGSRELDTVSAAADVLQELAAIPLKGIPASMLQDAQGVAIIPDVVKAGLVIGGRFGRGVMLVRKPDGTWSDPIFISLTGGSLGWQIGVQATDVVLVFKTRGGLERILKGRDKLTLGADAAVAAGPIGRQAEAATDAQLKAEIYSYSRSRGLFVGVSLEGAGLCVDHSADQAFYGVGRSSPADIQARSGQPVPEPVARLQSRLMTMSAPPVPPPPPILLPPGGPVVVPPPPTPVLPPPRVVPVPVPVPPPPQR